MTTELPTQRQVRAEQLSRRLYKWLLVSGIVSVPWMIFNHLHVNAGYPDHYDNYPTWSSDGRQLFLSRGGALMTLDLDGAATRQLADLDNIDNLVASPDRQQLAVTDCIQSVGECALYVMDVDSSGLTRLTDIRLRLSDLAWSPDAQQIVFMSGSAIYSVQVEGGQVRTLVSDEAYDALGQIAWSPDGQTIAFSNADEIYLMGVDASRIALLQDAAWYVDDLAWSPDGARLAYAAPALHTINLDGSERHDVAPGLTVTEGVGWSPDGRQLAFGHFFALYTVNADGTRLTKFSEIDAGWISQVAWSPSGTQIAFELDENCDQDYLGICEQRHEVRVINPNGFGRRNLSVQRPPPPIYLWWVSMPGLIHVLLLPGLWSPYRFVRRHTQQALLIAGLRAASTAVLIGLTNAHLLAVGAWILVNGSLWLFGCLVGLRQVKLGDCWLMRQTPERHELPRPWAAARLVPGANPQPHP